MTLFKQSKLKITVRQESQYGQAIFYPVCEQAHLFTQLTGTKTLPTWALQVIANMGYIIDVQPVKLREFVKDTRSLAERFNDYQFKDIPYSGIGPEELEMIKKSNLMDEIN